MNLVFYHTEPCHYGIPCVLPEEKIGCPMSIRIRAAVNAGQFINEYHSMVHKQQWGQLITYYIDAIKQADEAQLHLLKHTLYYFLGGAYIHQFQALTKNKKANEKEWQGSEDMVLAQALEAVLASDAKFTISFDLTKEAPDFARLATSQQLIILAAYYYERGIKLSLNIDERITYADTSLRILKTIETYCREMQNVTTLTHFILLNEVQVTYQGVKELHDALLRQREREKQQQKPASPIEPLQPLETTMEELKSLVQAEKAHKERKITAAAKVKALRAQRHKATLARNAKGNKDADTLPAATPSSPPLSPSHQLYAQACALFAKDAWLESITLHLQGRVQAVQEKDFMMEGNHLLGIAECFFQLADEAFNRSEDTHLTVEQVNGLILTCNDYWQQSLVTQKDLLEHVKKHHITLENQDLLVATEMFIHQAYEVMAATHMTIKAKADLFRKTREEAMQRLGEAWFKNKPLYAQSKESYSLHGTEMALQEFQHLEEKYHSLRCSLKEYHIEQEAMKEFPKYAEQISSQGKGSYAETVKGKTPPVTMASKAVFQK